MPNRVLIFGLLAAVLSFPAAATGAWVTSDEYDDFNVVVSDSASEAEYYAAFRFQGHWSRVTGYRPTVSRTPRRGKVNVWTGPTENPFVESLDLESLGEEGFIVKTVLARRDADLTARDEDLAGKHLLLVGGRARGTIYAEWEFFESVLGVRALNPGGTIWPEAPAAIPEIDLRRVPAFEYRDISYRVFRRGLFFASIHHLNGHWSGMPAGWGGGTGYVRGMAGFGHTFHYYVDPDEYYDEHPEYFAEIGGRRVKYAQLCLTNADVLDITIRKVRDLLRNAAPHERIVSVSQMDYFWFDSWCTCSKCRAIDEREGSPSGSIIHFVNQVADAIAAEFPEALIDTFAYTYSRRPPKRLKTRDNVLVRLCAFECDYSRPISDRRSPRNRAFARDLKKWSRITENLHIWDYTQNWFSYQGPHPNIHVLQPNIEFFAKNGVKGVYAQGSPESPHSDFEFLKAYILAKSLWDPKVDWRELYGDFMEAYYGEGAPFVEEYLRLITERVKRDDVVLTFANRMAWMDYGLVERAQEIFARAFAQITDGITLERLRYAYLPVQYAALVCPPRVYRGNDEYVLTRPPSQTFDEYWAMLETYGVTHLNDYSIDRFRERLDGKTPPRYETVKIEKVRNEHLEMWVLPSKGGAVVRLLDLATGRDFFTGYEDILSVRGKYQEWAVLEDEEWAEPQPVDEAYEVIERGADYIVLQARLETGLELRREMRLLPGHKAFEVTLHVTNRGETPVEPVIGLYPEFSTAGLGKPQLWIERGGAWSRFGLKKRNASSVYEEEFEAKGVSRWAYRFPRAQTSIVNTVDAADAESLSYIYVPDRASISMGQRMPRRELAPGEVRSLHTRFQITGVRPKAL